MIDTFNFYVVADRRFVKPAIVYGLFFTEGQATLFRDAFHSTAKIFKCNKSNIFVDDYGIKLNTGLTPVK